MKILAMVTATVCLIASTAGAAQFGGVEEISAYLAPHYFQWEEFHQGEKLLREQGWLMGAGGTARVNLLKAEAGSLMATGRAELFGGIVDYDGQTQGPDNLPVKTDVNYFGTREDVDLGWRISQQKLSVEPFFGLGARWWLRDLDDSTTVNRSGVPVMVNGYTEDWRSFYLRLGGRFDVVLTDDWRLFAEGGAKYPFYTENAVEISGDDVTIKPDGRWSGFAEVGARYNKLKLSLFYEGFRYDQSPGVVVGTFRYFQPISKSDIFGLRFGWAFR
ncbi:hypothetical protein [Geotalea sp. SG265]|uniref:hypothetical protein n=1 Tax=Geotalea sp. SG265 TaxID=2922867 RepID=UPI001FAFF86F|nr:hypothetical protein [Geotalea sp. SG265]